MPRTIKPENQKIAITGLIEAGIAEINSVGVDQISVNSVTLKAKTSRPTFYSYFGDINGLLAEIWLAKCDQWLEMLSDAETPVAKRTRSDKQVINALTQIFATAHRIPEVLELVEPRMAQWWESQEGKTEVSKLKLTWLVANRIGITVTELADPDVTQAAFVEPLINAIDDNVKLELAKPDMPKLTEPVVVVLDLEAKLLNAAIEVIASSGVKAASMARVARKAQVSTGAVYPRFSKVDDIIEGSFEVAIRGVIQQNFEQLGSRAFSGEDFGNFVMAGLLPARKTWRNFRIEIYLGCIGRPDLTKRLRQNLTGTNAMVATRLSPYDKTQMVQGPIPYMVHSVGVGMATLHNAGIPLLTLDHRLLSVEMVRIAISQFSK